MDVSDAMAKPHESEGAFFTWLGTVLDGAEVAMDSRKDVTGALRASGSLFV